MRMNQSRKFTKNVTKANHDTSVLYAAIMYVPLDELTSAGEWYI